MAKQAEAETLMAQGLAELLKPIVQECDDRLRAVFASQSDLAKQIDILNAGIVIGIAQRLSLDLADFASSLSFCHGPTMT